MTTSKNVMLARSVVGNAARSGDPERLKNARRDLAAAKLEAFIDKTIADAPPLTVEQLNRVAVLLRPAAGGAGK